MTIQKRGKRNPTTSSGESAAKGSKVSRRIRRLSGSRPADAPSTSKSPTMIEDLWRPQLLGEFPHTPHYDVRKAAPSYSNLAAVQAGFALAAVVLIASTIGIANTSTVVKFYRDWATSFFLLAFFGSILSALLLGVIAGEEILSPRTNMIALFGAIGFSVSTSLELWGLVELVKIYLDTNVLQVARWTFIIFSCIQPLYMTFIAVDNIFLFWDRFHTALFKHHPDPHPRPHEWCLVIICGYLPLIIALFVCFVDMVTMVDWLHGPRSQTSAHMGTALPGDR